MVQMMNNIKTGTYIRVTENGEETYNFNFYTNLLVYDKLRFVDSVVGTLVNETRYNSIIRDLVFDFEIIEKFTDVDTSLIYTNLDDDGNPVDVISDVERFLFETNVVEIVKANVPPTLFDELNKAIDDNIAYLTGIQLNSLSDALTSLFSTFEKKMSEVDMTGMMDIITKFVGMAGEFTPENVVNAYMNSDVHKQNLVEIEEAKKQRTELVESVGKTINVVEGNEKSNKKVAKKTKK